MKVANGSGLCARRSPLAAQVRWLTAQLQYSPQNQPVYSVQFEPAKARPVERRMKLAAQLHHLLKVANGSGL
jgi:hypothetical protein